MEKIRSFNKMLNGALERVNELKEVEERRTKTGEGNSVCLYVCLFPYVCL